MGMALTWTVVELLFVRQRVEHGSRLQVAVQKISQPAQLIFAQQGENLANDNNTEHISGSWGQVCARSLRRSK